MLTIKPWDSDPTVLTDLLTTTMDEFGHRRNYEASEQGRSDSVDELDNPNPPRNA